MIRPRALKGAKRRGDLVTILDASVDGLSVTEESARIRLRGRGVVNSKSIALFWVVMATIIFESAGITGTARLVIRLWSECVTVASAHRTGEQSEKNMIEKHRYNFSPMIY